MKYYEVYISKKNDNYSVILRTNKPLETLELWVRTVVNKYFPDFNVVDADYTSKSFFLYNDDFEFIHVMFKEREGYHV